MDSNFGGRFKRKKCNRISGKMKRAEKKVYYKEETNLGVLIKVVPWRIIFINKVETNADKELIEDKHTYEHKEFLRM